MNGNEKMRMCLYEAQTADGKTVQIISRFDEKTVDPVATQAVVMPLLQKTPEFLKWQNIRAKNGERRKLANTEWELAEKARKDGDTKSEAAHWASYKAALSAMAEVEKELNPLIDDYNAAFTRLYDENRQYCDCGPHQKCCGGRYEALKAKFDALKEHERLTGEGEVIADWRGIEFWRKEDGKWIKEKFEFIGELPKNYVLPENLTPEMQKEIDDQQKEIAEKQEAERVKGLTKEKKAEEKESRIRFAAREANQKAEDAELLEEKFDKKEWFAAKKKEIEAKYA